MCQQGNIHSHSARCYLLDIQANNGIQNFTADDVEVLPGTDIDAIVVNIVIQAVDSIEKIYMTIEVN